MLVTWWLRDGYMVATQRRMAPSAVRERRREWRHGAYSGREDRRRTTTLAQFLAFLPGHLHSHPLGILDESLVAASQLSAHSSHSDGRRGLW